MMWNIANAKQQLSEVIRLSVQEPQPIYNRAKRVAAVISTDDLDELERLRAEHHVPSLTEQFAQIRAILAAQGEDGIEIPPRMGRPTPFDDPNWDR